MPLVIGLERGDHSLSVYRTACLDEGSESAALNLVLCRAYGEDAALAKGWMARHCRRATERRRAYPAGLLAGRGSDI